jgi:hypothetical protein
MADPGWLNDEGTPSWHRARANHAARIVIQSPTFILYRLFLPDHDVVATHPPGLLTTLRGEAPRRLNAAQFVSPLLQEC